MRDILKAFNAKIDKDMNTNLIKDAPSNGVKEKEKSFKWID